MVTSVLSRLNPFGSRGAQVAALEDKIATLEQNAIHPGAEPFQMGWSGEKFLGGFGITRDYEVVDQYLLRKRSRQLFTDNIYARGLLRRLLTNEINKGLALEATPDADVLGLDPEDLARWSENTERRFTVWGSIPEVCDYQGALTFGLIQRQARMMALVGGDVLTITRLGPENVPNIELVVAEHVVDPVSSAQIKAVRARRNKTVDGVEVDSAGRHVAFFVKQDDGSTVRIPAYGPRTGRLQAWLVYGTEKLSNEVRGQSILALVLQSLKEVDRYRDSEQRAAVVNSMIAMWVKKDEDKPSSLPITGGATRRDVVTTQNDSEGRKDVTFSTQMPGMMMQELQQGESPVSYDTTRPNVNYATFETAILSAVAWANEVPPETLFLQFQNNYSASRGATNEFKMYLDRVRCEFGSQFCARIYKSFLVSEVLNSNIESDDVLQATIGRSSWDRLGSWLLSDWAGAIKPNVDLLKEVKAYKELVNEGWLTRDRAARELTGMKYSKVVQQLCRENEELAEALRPLINAGIVKDENPGVDPVEEGPEPDEPGDNVE